MALSIPTLSGLIKSNIESLYGAADDDTKLQQFCDALATAIVTHIQTDAQVIIGGGSSAGTYGVS